MEQFNKYESDIIETIKTEAINHILRHKQVPCVCLSKTEYEAYKQTKMTATVQFKGKEVAILVRCIS